MSTPTATPAGVAARRPHTITPKMTLTATGMARGQSGSPSLRVATGGPATAKANNRQTIKVSARDCALSLASGIGRLRFVDSSLIPNLMLTVIYNLT